MPAPAPADPARVAVLTVDDDPDVSRAVSRDLRPGENARLVVSPFKSISVEEVPLGALAAPANEGRMISVLPTPRTLERRFG